MKKLLELETRLRKAKEELDKSLLGDMNPMSSEMGKMDGADAAVAGDVNSAGMQKEDVETCGKMDSKKDQKIIAEALDDHNEKKHGEAKDTDSAKKSEDPEESKSAPQKPDHMKSSHSKALQIKHIGSRDGNHDFEIHQDGKKIGNLTHENDGNVGGHMPDHEDTPVEQKAVKMVSDAGKRMNKADGELIKFHANGQWSLNKAAVDAKPDGEFDVPVKEVYDGDDQFVHVGNRGVDGDDKGKTQKLSDKEKDLLKD